MFVGEFLALPEDGIRRMLIDGCVREVGMTVRRWIHGRIELNISYSLNAWSRGRPKPRGIVVDGETGFRLAADRVVGVDLAYVSVELAAATPESRAYFQGAPTLVVEILSPSDRLGDVDDKILAYLDAGVAVVWVVHPRQRTVTSYRPGATPRHYGEGDQIDAEPHLPGFRAPVGECFED